MDLSQEEFLRFLNCRVVLNKDHFEKQTVLDANNKPVTIIKQHGKFQSLKVKLDETAINNKIVRIPLPRKKFADVKENQTKNVPEKGRGVKRRKNISSYGRKIKQKKLSDGFVADVKEESSESSDDSEILPVTTKRKTTNRVVDSKPTKPSVAKQKNGAILKSEILPVIRNVAKASTVKRISKTPHRTDRSGISGNKTESDVIQEPTYYLHFPKTTFPVDGRLNYKFENLVLDIKNMELPSASWKIKVVIRKNKIASIIFTNKCDLERCVSFTEKSQHFYITIDNRSAILLGSPQTVDSVKDIEVLLNIVHNIDAHNPMILYKK